VVIARRLVGLIGKGGRIADILCCNLGVSDFRLAVVLRGVYCFCRRG
jgi:hypothetical protein